MDLNTTKEEWNTNYVKTLIPNIIFNIICLIIGFTGNSVVLFVYFFKMKYRREDRFFIPVLTVFDLIAGTASTIFHITDYFYFVSYPSEAVCVGLNFTIGLTSTASAHMLLVIGMQRYLKICRPHGFQLTLVRRRIAIFVIVGVSLSFSIPIAIVTGLKNVTGTFKGYKVTGISCSNVANTSSVFNSQIFFGCLLIVLAINTIATVVVYIPIGRIIHKRLVVMTATNSKAEETSTTENKESTNQIQNNCQGRNMFTDSNVSQPRTEDPKGLQRARKSRVNFNMMFFTLVIFYMLSYTPTLIMFVITTSDSLYWYKLSSSKLNLYIFLNRLFVIHHIVNPFVYGYFDLVFRKSLSQVFRCN
ncbi:5-hydroxytryptamine receptor 2C-like [Mytilus edulis]|uniref:5-hydroxytryptamine receptor 2C-like n=1 Tax=Mytilus edulis TaxID=6550 RepID=UPI0039EEFAB1